MIPLCGGTTTSWIGDFTDNDDCSGFSVSLTPELLATGCPTFSTTQEEEIENKNYNGIVRIYSRIEGKDFHLVKQIVGHPGDELGFAIAVSENSNTVIMGAPSSDATGVHRGHAMVVHYNDLTQEWDVMSPLLTGKIDNENFGRSVAISKDGLIVGVGSRCDELNRGSINIYVYKEMSKVWEQLGNSIEGHTVNEEFGTSLDIAGDISYFYVVAGSPNYEHGKGKASVHYYDEDSGWIGYGNEIVGHSIKDRFGTDVALAMDKNNLILAVGAPSNEYYGGDEIDNWGTDGHVSIYRLDLRKDGFTDDFGEYYGIEWESFVEDIKEVMEDDKTGTALTLSEDGTKLVIGSPNYNDHRGMVRVYEYDENHFQYDRIGEDIVGGQGDKLGSSVSISGNLIAVGAAGGSYTTIYGYDESQPKASSRTSTWFLPIMLFTLLVVIFYYALRKVKRAGFSFTSIAKALPSIDRRSHQRKASTPLSTEEKKDDWPFPFFSEGERLRIAELRRKEHEILNEGNVDRVVLHGMIKSSGSEDGSKHNYDDESEDEESYESEVEDESKRIV